MNKDDNCFESQQTQNLLKMYVTRVAFFQQSRLCIVQDQTLILQMGSNSNSPDGDLYSISLKLRFVQCYNMDSIGSKTFSTCQCDYICYKRYLFGMYLLCNGSMENSRGCPKFAWVFLVTLLTKHKYFVSTYLVK